MDKKSLQTILEFLIEKLDPGVIRTEGPVFHKEGKRWNVKVFCFYGVMTQPFAVLDYYFDLKKNTDEEILQAISASWLELFGLMIGIQAEFLSKEESKLNKLQDYVV